MIIQLITGIVEVGFMDALKNMAFQLDKTIDNLFLVLGVEIDGKANLMIYINRDLVTAKKYNAGKMIRTLAKEIKGGGGGQPFFATAGGRDVSGLERALTKVKGLI